MTHYLCSFAIAQHQVLPQEDLLLLRFIIRLHPACALPVQIAHEIERLMLKMAPCNCSTRVGPILEPAPCNRQHIESDAHETLEIAVAAAHVKYGGYE